jgi:uncharacterized protein YbcV (DUF1398 family)
MKSTILILSLLFISVGTVQAQTEKKLNTGNVSLYLCSDYSGEKDEITEIFTGFTNKGKKKFKVVARLQDFAPNVVHQLEIRFINPANKSMFDSEKIPFILKSNMSVHNQIDNVDATFDMEGIYQVQALIDDKIVQYLNFNIGGHVAQNMGKGNVGMVVCSDYDDDKDTILGMYTGVKRPKDTQLKLFLRFQDFPLNVANKAIIKLITPAGKDLLSKKEIAFTHGHNVHVYNHTANLTVPLSTSGVYQFQVEVNGKTVQYLNFNVGNE